ncbi:hypothetical protein LSAT2_024799 [Lamellibrachia satsuma]|nr:hypothetical protein LSAT2_024799 [Lamellibrachia satsuma]
MNRQQESLKHKPSIAGNRAIRAHKRDVERKMLRDETLNRHRNLSAMSPLKENARNMKAGQKKSQEMKGEQDAKENRKQMLQKWKAERELKKKLQQREQGKKPMFRVTHIEPGTVPFSKPPPQRKHVDAPPVKIERRVTRASVAAAKPPAASTRSAQGRTSTTGKVNTTRPKQSNASGPSGTMRSSTRPSNNKPKGCHRSCASQSVDQGQRSSTSACCYG